MRQPPQGRLRLPPRGLHLPRLSGSERIALWAGALAVAAVAARSVSRHPPGPASERDERAAVALALYGQDDPDTIAAAGLHGLGGRSVRVTVERAGPCRFTVAAPGLSETLDLRQVAGIRYAVVGDPAANLARSIEPRSGAAPPALVLAIVSGGEAAVCGAQQCQARRAFALSDPGRLEAARAAAASLLHEICPATPQSPP